MFNDFSVKSDRHEYFVRYRPWETVLKKKIQPSDVVIIDSIIVSLYPEIERDLKEALVLKLDAKEHSKSYSQIGIILEKIVSEGFSKPSKIIAIGGGITQDVASFAASVLLRGVEWIFFPTNLASQCDSCIGSKTSVNLGDYKNQLGGFYPPTEIFIDFEFCKSLPNIDICAGLGEMMHYFLVDGPNCLITLIREIKQAKTDYQVLSKLIERSLKIKKRLVELDEYDRGPRRVFNYGHTFGHALEAATNFAVPHGIAVAYGIDLANLISVNRGFIKMDVRNEVRDILAEIVKVFALPKINTEAYIGALKKDKKNTDGILNPILTKGLGRMFQTSLILDGELINLIAEFFVLKLYEKNL